MDEIRWSRGPFGLLDSTGLCRIQKAEPNEPGFRGYKLYVGGEHVRTHVRLKDAKADAAEVLAFECVACGDGSALRDGEACAYCGREAED